MRTVLTLAVRLLVSSSMTQFSPANAGSKPSATEARYSIDIDQSESQSVAQISLDAVHRLRSILCFLIFCLHLAEMEVVATG